MVMFLLPLEYLHQGWRRLGSGHEHCSNQWYDATLLFLLMFPPTSQLIDMIDLADQQWTYKLELNKAKQRQQWNVEILPCRLADDVEFTSRASLCGTIMIIPTCTSLWLHRNVIDWFDDIGLLRAMRWSYQPLAPWDSKSSEQQYRDGGLLTTLSPIQWSPSKLLQSFQLHLCWKVHEPLIRTGMPFDQSWPPSIWSNWLQAREHGCEIQNAMCGWSGVVLHLKLVRKEIDLVYGKDDNDDVVTTKTTLLHGTNVLKHVVSPWWFGSNRIVCPDSSVASVWAEKEMYRNGFGFIEWSIRPQNISPKPIWQMLNSVTVATSLPWLGVLQIIRILVWVLQQSLMSQLPTETTTVPMLLGWSITSVQPTPFLHVTVVEPAFQSKICIKYKCYTSKTT